MPTNPSPSIRELFLSFLRLGATSFGGPFADEGIPAYVTGRATVYQWQCREGPPEIIRQLVEPDARGFLSNIWYEIRRK
jgi:hypothetical protein